MISEKNPAVANRIAKSLRAGIARLKDNPQLGRRVRQAPDQWAPEEMRDWVTGDYVARYLLLKDRIVSCVSGMDAKIGPDAFETGTTPMVASNAACQL